ncbi:hypothetical protein EROM_090860 [Encephalitozoon romaleae SJ-2008]|uniref:WD40 domain-containing protein n=1 Tax=Encephalitozoon romaleae (strain SJ-2008) TaxID=1178016 RepID=I7ATE3_ENCRO|nr:hypothetical protein EROM_090860 [Encephalitozoon romaleae SJ-2008]AFN83702.1 hypothetical protein EROM_090860 [Encephalitozoon romaleae SJ-2008]
MVSFDSTVLVETDAKRDFKLPHTRQMILIETVFAIQSSPFPKYLYVYDKGFTVYQLAPFKPIKTFGYSGEVIDVGIIKGKMAILSKDSIIVYNRDEDYVVTGKFDGRLSEVDGKLGLQERAKLTLYSLDSLNVESVYKANAHYSVRDVLVTSFDNTVSLYCKGKKLIEISMPERICRVCTDPLLTNIYCGSSDGTIFCCNTSYMEPVTMRYHKSKIVGLDISFCGRHLYSADMEGVVCIWDIKFNVVVGKVSMETAIRGIKVAYVSEWKGELDAMESELVEIRK